jgi:hypothetical protein
MPRPLSRGLIGAVLALAACGTARIVQRTPYGGVIELQGDHNKAMEQANEQMAAQCANFIVVREGNEPGGAADPPPGAPVATIYRVHYQCGDAAPPGAPPPPRND